MYNSLVEINIDGQTLTKCGSLVISLCIVNFMNYTHVILPSNDDSSMHRLRNEHTPHRSKLLVVTL